MRLAELELDVTSHSGEFVCERIHKPTEHKSVRFCHAITPPEGAHNLPDIGRLHDFFENFGSIVFYVDEKSGDAAKYIASPAEWAALDREFRRWIDSLDEAEPVEILPDWMEGCLVVGEEPGTGNYIPMSTSGKTAGRVVAFDHDGYEFSEQAVDLVEFVERMLSPDDSLLVEIATNMRFIEADPETQWWIRELRDSRGNFASTAV